MPVAAPSLTCACRFGVRWQAKRDTALGTAGAISEFPSRLEFVLNRYDLDFETGLGFSTLEGMSKAKVPATGEGYLGEIMVHKITHVIGVVENVIEGREGWPPQIALKLKDGSVKKGHLSDFREPSHAEREKYSPADPTKPSPKP